MIRRVEALHFQCLRDVDVELEDFHVLVGPNASGKTTFLDVVAFLGDLVSTGVVEAAVSQRTQNFLDLVWQGEGRSIELALELSIPKERRVLLQRSSYARVRYEVAIGYPEQIDELIRFAVDCHVEEVFCEPVNPRGRGLSDCQGALQLRGYQDEADAIGKIRHRQHWSQYVAGLVANVQQSVRRHFDIEKLRFLLYPSRLLPEDMARIMEDDAGVVWLGRQQPGASNWQSRNHQSVACPTSSPSICVAE